MIIFLNFFCSYFIQYTSTAASFLPLIPVTPLPPLSPWFITTLSTPRKEQAFQKHQLKNAQQDTVRPATNFHNKAGRGSPRASKKVIDILLPLSGDPPPTNTKSTTRTCMLRIESRLIQFCDCHFSPWFH